MLKVAGNLCMYVSWNGQVGFETAAKMDVNLAGVDLVEQYSAMQWATMWNSLILLIKSLKKCKGTLVVLFVEMGEEKTKF